MKIWIFSLVIDGLILVGLFWLAIWAGQKRRDQVGIRKEVAQQIELRDRKVFTTGAPVFSQYPAQEGISIVGQHGLAPGYQARPDTVPREGILDFGHVDPWEVSVERHHGEPSGIKKPDDDLQ